MTWEVEIRSRAPDPRSARRSAPNAAHHAASIAGPERPLDRLWVLKTRTSARSLRSVLGRVTLVGCAEPPAFLASGRPRIRQDPPPAGRRNSRSAAPTWRAQTLRQTTTAQQRRPGHLGAAVALVEQLERRAVRSSRHSRGRAHPGTCCATGMASTARSFGIASSIWASRK